MTRWLVHHAAGWYIWLPGAMAVGALLVRSRTHPESRRAALVATVVVWLVMCEAAYLLTRWHRFFEDRRPWAAGVASILVIFAIGPVVCLLTEAATARLQWVPLRRWLLLVLVAAALTFFGADLVGLLAATGALRLMGKG